MEKLEENNIENLLSNKWVQIIVNSIIKWSFNSHLWLFTKNKKIDKEFMENFIIWLYNWLNESWNFLYNIKDIEKWNFSKTKLIENIKDNLNMLSKPIEKLDKKEKMNIRNEFNTYIVNKIDKIECFETKTNLMKLFAN